MISKQFLSGTYRARWVVPMSDPPLHNGWVSFHHGQVTGLGRKPEPAGAVDLGDVALLPGLVNAHTHLEFSRLTEPLGQANGTLPDWIAEVLRHRAALPAKADAAARRNAIRAGLDESADAGVRLVGEIITDPWPLQTLGPHHPDLVAFCEILGLQPGRQQATWAVAEDRLPNAMNRVQFGISPHAPYSTAIPLIKRAVEWSRVERVPLAMHVAESSEELELVESGRGPFRSILEKLGVWREGLFPWEGGMDGLLRLLSRARRTLLVHGNYLRRDQIAFLASQPQMAVVYCPRTHHYFGHPRHPIAEMRAAGVRVVLGTDSRASNPDLNIWNEIRFLAERRTDLDPETLVRMVTIDAADAFARADCGRLSVGAMPGLVAVATVADRPSDLWLSLCRAEATPVTSPTTRDFIA